MSAVARLKTAGYDAAMSWPSRVETLEVLRRIKDSPLGDRLILAGSSGMYGVSETIPALTEDIDVLVDADWLAAQEDMVLEHMHQLGFQHQKGSKDKLQALLVIAENAGDEDFLGQLRGLLGAFPVDRVEDAIADAHAALLAVSADVTVAGPQAAGYAGMHAKLEQGLTLLQRLAGPAEARS